MTYRYNNSRSYERISQQSKIGVGYPGILMFYNEKSSRSFQMKTSAFLLLNLLTQPIGSVSETRGFVVVGAAVGFVVSWSAGVFKTLNTPRKL